MPTLNRARFTSSTGDDNKDKDTGVYVYVYTSNGATKLAQIENADNSDKDATEYNDHSTHSIDLSVLSATEKSECVNFTFKVGSKANGNDKWKIRDANVELFFTDGTNLTRSTGSFELNSKGSKYTEASF